MRAAGAPEGKTTKMPDLPPSKIFPGTTRDWWVYVPPNYDPATPANLLLCFDGGGGVRKSPPSHSLLACDSWSHIHFAYTLYKLHNTLAISRHRLGRVEGVMVLGPYF